MAPRLCPASSVAHGGPGQGHKGSSRARGRKGSVWMELSGEHRETLRAPAGWCRSSAWPAGERRCGVHGAVGCVRRGQATYLEHRAGDRVGVLGSSRFKGREGGLVPQGSCARGSQKGESKARRRKKGPGRASSRAECHKGHCGHRPHHHHPCHPAALTVSVIFVFVLFSCELCRCPTPSITRAHFHF